VDYVRALREKVGHMPLILPGAAVLILDDLGRVLLQLRTDNGAWGLPAGYMEPGESLEDTARREVLEETGLEVGAMALLGVFSGPDFFYQYPNGDQVFNVTVAYVARDVRGEVRLNPAEGHELRYFDLRGLPRDLSPRVGVIIKRYLAEADVSGRCADTSPVHNYSSVPADERLES
jgi:8-oxo-dGTP pyrophosphatase MutT (NUDIX family)